MKQNKFFRQQSQKLLAVLMVLGMLISLLPNVALAQDARIAINRPVTLQGRYCHETLPFVDVQFDIYRVADVAADGTYTYTKRFQPYRVTLDISDDDGVRDMTNTLVGYVQRDDLQPDGTAVTNDNGIFTYTDKPGIFLVMGASSRSDLDEKNSDKYHLKEPNFDEKNEVTYEPQPFLISLPYTDTQGNREYDVDLEVKYSMIPYTDEPEGDNPGGDDPAPTSDKTLRVQKVWKTVYLDGANAANGTAPKHPSAVSVDLLRDGVAIRTVELNESNGWSFDFTGLSAAATYTVVESSVPEGYTTAVKLEDDTAVITNTTYVNPPEPEPESPENPPDTPEQDVPGIQQDSDDPLYDLDDPNAPRGGKDPDANGKLPQTGLPYLYVYGLGIMGLIFLFTAYLAKKREQQ
jgi:hypothetical protein